MRSRTLYRAVFVTASWIFYSGMTDGLAQQFPVGAYWVKKTDGSEAREYYSQVKECGMNIVVGGNKYSNTNLLGEILSAAKNNGITVIVDKVNSYNRLQRYGGSGRNDDTWGAYRKPYDSDGYLSIPDTRLPLIEARQRFIGGLS